MYPPSEPGRFPRLAVHTRTNRPWSLRECCEQYAAAGVAGISVWRDLLDPAKFEHRKEQRAKLVEMKEQAFEDLPIGNLLDHRREERQRLSRGSVACAQMPVADGIFRE